MNTNYLTLPLTSYDPTLQDRAADLANRVVSRVGRRRTRAVKGSYSFLTKARGAVAAKIIIYERGRKPILREDGIYILTAVLHQNDSGETIAVGPWWNSRYRYTRLSSDQNLEETADFLQVFCDTHDNQAYGDTDHDIIPDVYALCENSQRDVSTAGDPAAHPLVTRDGRDQEVAVNYSGPERAIARPSSISTFLRTLLGFVSKFWSEACRVTRLT